MSSGSAGLGLPAARREQLSKEIADTPARIIRFILVSEKLLE